MDLLRCDLMFPNRRDIIQYNLMTVEVGVHTAIIFCEELRDESKDTTKYCIAIRGAKSMKKVLAEERRADLVITTSNRVSESLQVVSTNFLQVFGIISIPHAAEMGQSWTKNDHGRAHKNLVTGRKSKKKIDSK